MYMRDTKQCRRHGEVRPLRGVPAPRLAAHIVLTVMTCGTWAAVWIIDSVASGVRGRCPVCDGRVT